MFERVVSSAQVGEVIVCGRPADRGGGGVVLVASVCGAGASGRAASFIPCAQVAAKARGRPVPVDRDRDAGDGGCEHPIPPGCEPGESSGEGGLDRSVPGQDRWTCVRGAGESECGDRQLNLRGHRLQPRPGGCGGGSGGEQQVAQDVSAHLRERAVILLLHAGRTTAGCGIGVGVATVAGGASRPRDHAPSAVVTTISTVCITFTTAARGRAVGGAFGVVEDVAGAAGEGVVDRVGEGCGKVGDQACHPVIQVEQSDRAGLVRAVGGVGERVGVDGRSDDFHRRRHPRRRLRPCGLQGEGFETGTIVGRAKQHPDATDRPRVRRINAAVLPHLQGGGEVLTQQERFRHAPLHTPIRHPQRHRELQCDLSQR